VGSFLGVRVFKIVSNTGTVRLDEDLQNIKKTKIKSLMGIWTYKSE